MVSRPPYMCSFGIALNLYVNLCSVPVKRLDIKRYGSSYNLMPLQLDLSIGTDNLQLPSKYYPQQQLGRRDILVKYAAHKVIVKQCHPVYEPVDKLSVL